jgi:HAD superfamily hydrolase (TIGR01509 family)
MQTFVRYDIYRKGEIMNIQLCILNAEGILLDTNKSLIETWQATAKQYGIEIPEGFFENILSAGYDHHQKAFYQYPRLAQIEHEVIEKHRKLPVEIQSQIHEVLDYLKSNHIKIAIVSDNKRKDILPKIASILKDYDISVLVCSNEVLNYKPDPNIYFKAAKLSDVKPNNTLVIDDSRNGCYGAHLAFMRSVFYQNALPLSERLFKYSYRQVTQLNDIIEIIRQENDLPKKVIFFILPIPATSFPNENLRFLPGYQ